MTCKEPGVHLIELERAWPHSSPLRPSTLNCSDSRQANMSDASMQHATATDLPSLEIGMRGFSFGGGIVPTLPASKVRRSKRIATRKQASVVVNLESRPERVPCLILDISPDGFRLRTNYRLRRGQAVEIHSSERLDAVPCRVVWVGKERSKYDGEVGLQTITTFETTSSDSPPNGSGSN